MSLPSRIVTVTALALLVGEPRSGAADAGFWEEAALRPRAVPSDSLYAERPDIRRCREGELVPAERERVLQAVNALRALHRLAPVTYDTRSEPLARKAALMMAASGALTHFPDARAPCSSADGRAGSAQSNLYLGTFPPGLVPSSEMMIAGWMHDLNVPQLGHRRWLLDPYLASISFGRIDVPTPGRSASALRVFEQAVGPPAAEEDFVAYPYGAYPAFLFDPKADWSVSVFELSPDKFDSQFAYFDRATVEVREEESGRSAEVSRLARDAQGFGLPNALSWRVTGVQLNRWYQVQIGGVARKAGGTRELRYRVYINDAPPQRTVEKNGLVWERKSFGNGGDTFTLAEAQRYCAALHGRLPTIAELQGLVAKGRQVSIDIDVLANVTSRNYWSATPWEGGPGFQNVIAFWSGGDVYQQSPAQQGAALCVIR